LLEASYLALPVRLGFRGGRGRRRLEGGEFERRGLARVELEGRELQRRVLGSRACARKKTEDAVPDPVPDPLQKQLPDRRHEDRVDPAKTISRCIGSHDDR